jgi:hypothetical protein
MREPQPICQNAQKNAFTGSRAAAGQVTADLKHHAGSEATHANASTRKKPSSGKI